MSQILFFHMRLSTHHSVKKYTLKIMQAMDHLIALRFDPNPKNHFLPPSLPLLSPSSDLTPPPLSLASIVSRLYCHPSSLGLLSSFPHFIFLKLEAVSYHPPPLGALSSS